MAIVLALLLEVPGQVVTREDLRRRLWPDDVFVDFENNLNHAVARLRETLGDSADRPRFIETVPKRGHRSSLCPTSDNLVSRDLPQYAQAERDYAMGPYRLVLIAAAS